MKLIYTLLLASCFITTSLAQNDLKKVKATVSKSEIQGHIYFLASDELKGRATASSELDIAAQYISTHFVRYGVKPVLGAEQGYFQTVPFIKTTAPTTLSLTLDGKPYRQLIKESGSNTNISGAAIFLNYGDSLDYLNQQVNGKVVVVKAGSNGKPAPFSPTLLRREKKRLASKYGAVGLVELCTMDEQLWKQGEHRFNGDRMELVAEESPFPYLWMADSNGEIATQFSSRKELPVELTIKGMVTSKVVSRNVVGMVEGTDPQLKNEYIIYSAHYDHIGIGEPNAENDSIFNGARDNAVGTVTVLSIAENLAKYPTKRSALFIMFTGEEVGLLGSKWYVEHPLLPLHQMVFCFNFDNGGYNDTSLITIIGLGRTTAEKSLKEAGTPFGLKVTDDPAPEQNLFDRSDNLHFAQKGIPAPTFGMGFTGFDQEIRKYYHQAADNPNTLDYEYLFKFFQAYVLAGRKIANTGQRPFWKVGDKYEAAGKKLYNGQISIK
ncbi:M28 family peptidase [Rhodocytophaga rosea]|uniref:M28 family peptidase n=1 Tax=Rhodocytophaga rosea TaxID=2704465 RepID=A0A6C0GBF8_9BACT|nr:M28 family peptidase [Rhodocytophaga rosea]QHT65276.1 M28 family peptidase [Rhodocytophaga rosea]